jgi:hypothetical protein
MTMAVKMLSLLPLTAFLLLHFYSFLVCVDEQGIKQAEAMYSYTQKHGYGRDQVRLFKAPYTSSSRPQTLVFQGRIHV